MTSSLTMDFDLITIDLSRSKCGYSIKGRSPGETSTEYGNFCTAKAIDELVNNSLFPVRLAQLRSREKQSQTALRESENGWLLVVSQRGYTREVIRANPFSFSIQFNCPNIMALFARRQIRLCKVLKKKISKLTPILLFFYITSIIFYHFLKNKKMVKETRHWFSCMPRFKDKRIQRTRSR
jgi:hypothetical protein